MTAKRAPARVPGRRPTIADVDLREHLLDAATRLFAERGIAATTLAQIATAAGVTTALVHYYFTNRETLLDAVVDEHLAPAAQSVWSLTAEDGNADPFALVQQFVARLFQVIEHMPWLPSLWLREVVSEGGLLRERMAKRLPFDSVRSFGARLVKAQQDGVVNPQIEAPLLFNSILALVMLPFATAAVWQGVRGMPSLDRDVLRRHVNALLLGGMQPPGGVTSRTRRTSSRNRS